MYQSSNVFNFFLHFWRILLTTRNKFNQILDLGHYEYEDNELYIDMALTNFLHLTDTVHHYFSDCYVSYKKGIEWSKIGP